MPWSRRSATPRSGGVMARGELGRHVFGLASIAFGVFSLVFHDFNIWQPLGPLGSGALHDALLDLYALAVMFGGLAVQWRKTARTGALVLSVTYAIFAVLWLPRWLVKPQSYDPLGNFFEQFSLVCGALMVFASTRRDAQRRTLERSSYYGFALCVVSFTLEQLFYLHGTAKFVPRWIPPGQMFWAVATTIAFALAAVALLTGRFALPAARLTAAMIAGFGLLVWLPAPFAQPHSLTAWAGNAENAAIGASAWIVAEYLSRTRSTG